MIQTTARSNRIKPNQTESNQIKPVRGKYLWHMELHESEMGFGGVKRGQTGSTANGREWARIDANDSDHSAVKPGQAESNQIKPVRGK
jgi:hypothetical protein